MGLANCTAGPDNGLEIASSDSNNRLPRRQIWRGRSHPQLFPASIVSPKFRLLFPASIVRLIAIIGKNAEVFFTGTSRTRCQLTRGRGGRGKALVRWRSWRASCPSKPIATLFNHPVPTPDFRERERGKQSCGPPNTCAGPA